MIDNFCSEAAYHFCGEHFVFGVNVHAQLFLQAKFFERRPDVCFVAVVEAVGFFAAFFFGELGSYLDSDFFVDISVHYIKSRQDDYQEQNQKS